MLEWAQKKQAALRCVSCSPVPSTYSDVLQVPAYLFNVNTAVKSHPATAEKPTEEILSALS